MVDKDILYWESIIFMNESKFNIFWSDGRITVWRKSNEELNPKNLLPTVKHGGGGIMVWGRFAASGMGNLAFIENNMNQSKYISILKENLKISAPKLGIQNTLKLYQDNDLKHTVKNVRLWLLQLSKSYQNSTISSLLHSWWQRVGDPKRNEVSGHRRLKVNRY
ncbi:Transposable element Tc1 transposase [Araneus ventricosus]|uniref:Transposable element Tc1 transposase n=1 Tax=Araneus ventricosus TaxID=182803 RepID=A0A4Y2A0T5_ARAVE|nr:Transposable element Tc1 transposase [Araneus ventricosus]